jgi:hypothetical protein
MLALIIVVCLTALQAVGTNANNKFKASESNVERFYVEAKAARVRHGANCFYCFSSCASMTPSVTALATALTPGWMFSPM